MTESKKRVAIVTGGGSGIGAASAERLAADGNRVLVIDVNAEGAAGVAESIRAAGGEADTSIFDVRDAAGWEAAARFCREQWGRIDVLFNNAGIFRDARAIKMTEEEWDDVVDISLKAAWLGARAVMPTMIEQEYGRLIATSSTSHLGNFGQANYSAAKGGLISLARTLALEGARSNITSNVIAPGSINTPLMLSMDEKFVEMFREACPMKRLGEPEEAAAVVSFLASPECSYVTGQLIHVCGGASIGA